MKKEEKVVKELTKKEVDEIQLRQGLVQNKLQEIQKLSYEHIVLKEGINTFMKALITQYKLDPKKKWQFTGSALEEVVKEVKK